jgi:Domain of unknown function (DUF4062)/TIR domain
MPFTYDIFISYAHLDDLSPFGDGKGWIDLFHERLSVLVSQALGYELRIWRDGHNLQGNDVLQGAIAEGITQSLLLVPIISPRYVQSDWCNREMAAFYASEPPPQAAVPGFRTRVFKVIKTPLPDHLKNLEPEQTRSLTGYQFYGADEEDGELHEFSTDPTDKAYWEMLTRLVAHITKTLIELKYSSSSPPAAEVARTTGAAAPPPVVASAKPVATPVVAPDSANAAKLVYLAETTSDLTKERELVRDELQQRGHSVLPDEKLPCDEAKQTEASVRADLARCALSVHLVGTRYGSTPEDDARSVVRIQEELAAERSAADAAFLRLIWMPPGLSTPALPISDERQKSFIAELQTRVMVGAELLQTTIEDLKTRIVEKLHPPAKTATRDRRSKLKQVYLICENSDRSFVRPLKEYLFKQNFEVITWLDEGAADKLMEYHHKNLRDCDAALIYFGSGDEAWVRKNLEDLEKAYGYGREQDWVANAVYVGAPENPQKEDFLTHMVPYVIRNFRSFDPNDLQDFVGKVQAAEGGK